MKGLLYVVAGASLMLAFFAAKQKQQVKALPVEDLAHKLQDAWADHHTKV